MATLRNFFWLELETGAFCIGILGIFGSLTSLYSNEATSMQSLAYLLACASLIFGTMKRIHFYLLPWIILDFIGIILTTFSIIILIILFFFDQEKMHRGFESFTSHTSIEVFCFTVLIAIYALLIYMFMAVSSLYVVFKKEHQRIAGFIPQNIGRNLAFGEGQII